MAKLRNIRVLLADDHSGLLATVRSLLNPDVEVVGCVDNGQSLFDAAMKLRPDVIVSDISMPKLTGIEAANRLRESCCQSKLVFLSVHTDPDVIHAAFETGALAYVLKTAITTDLLFAIGEAFAGRTFSSL